MNFLSNYNFLLLNNPTFNEQSVREDLISPFLKEVGYTHGLRGVEVIRDPRLKHPFVSIGSSRKRVSLVPDYLLRVHKRAAWILEAKSPSESITKSEHIEQAYSYAIHPETRVNYFSLCNGWEFSLYSIGQEQPLIHIPMSAMGRNLEFIKGLIGPEEIFKEQPNTLHKDFGLHIKRVGFKPGETLLIAGVTPMTIEKFADNHFSFSAPVTVDETAYLGTFDFSLDTAMQLEPFFKDRFSELLLPTNGSQTRYFLPAEFSLNVRISLPELENLVEVEKEIFLPLEIKEILPGHFQVFV